MVPANDVHGVISFYAGRRAAFVKLAAVLLPMFHSTADELRIDQDLTPDLTAGMCGVDELRDINRSIGVPIDRGQTVEDAVAQLRHEAPLYYAPLDTSAITIVR